MLFCDRVRALVVSFCGGEISKFVMFVACEDGGIIQGNANIVHTSRKPFWTEDEIS